MASPSAAGLPGKLAEVAALTSVEVAEILARAWGGRRRYVPAEPRPDHELSRLVGHDNARIIGAAMGNEEIVWPNAKPWLRLLDARRLLDEGLPIAGIAKRVGISENRARALLRGYGPPRRSGRPSAAVRPQDCVDCRPARQIAGRLGISERWVFQLHLNANRAPGQPLVPAPASCPSCGTSFADAPPRRKGKSKRAGADDEPFLPFPPEKPCE